MAKTKYEVLAEEITKILADINQITEKSRRCLKLVQLHFYVKVLPINVPPPPSSILSELVKTHAIGMRIYAPSQELQNACASYPIFGAFLPQHVLLSSQCKHIPPNTRFFTYWAVKITLPQEMEPQIEQGYWETLLYCPELAEISNEIDWFEKENYINSLSFQMQSALEIVGRENAGKSVIRKNLCQLALPHFSAIVEKWKNDPEGHDTIPNDLAIVFAKPFAPTPSDDLDSAYAKVRRTLQERSLRNYEHLMILWRGILENLVFANVDWTVDEKDVFIKKWEINIFGCPIKRPKTHDGRWKQTTSIDRETAGQIIKYFIDRFLIDPSKKKKDGETACLLWTLIWFAQDPEAAGITLTRILNFDTTNIDKENPAIIFDGKSIEISMGLYQLLKVLQGKGKGKRLHRLFSNLSEDYLQHVVKEASLSLFGFDTTPVLPAAFLSFPHPMKGTRISKKQRECLRAVDPGSEAGSARRQIHKMLRQSIAEKPPSSS